jgi:hypothetical protein
MSLFPYLAQHPEAAAAFNAGLAAAPEHEAIATAYDFSTIRTLVDVGGGHGTLIAAVLRAHPTLQGILFDQPSVVAGAPALLEAAGVAQRCRVMGGDFFAAIPAGGDAYILSSIIHDWDDDRAVAILANCRRAMDNSGRLLVVEPVVPPGNDFSLSKFSDLNMLAVTGGRERTEEEYRALYAAAGFRLTRVIPTRGSDSVIEGVIA